LALLLLVSGISRAVEAKEPEAGGKRPICIVALGSMEDGYVGPSRRALELLYGAPTKVLDPRKLPKEAFYPKRNRYRADKLLSYLNNEVMPGTQCRLVVGMTSVDISTTKGKVADWGIFGLGQVGGTACVVSTHRLIGKVSRKRGIVRVVKVVTHEVGHTLGLHHCEQPRCLMNDAKGKVKTVDDEPGELCEACRSLVRASHGDLVLPEAKPDWEYILTGKRSEGSAPEK